MVHITKDNFNLEQICRSGQCFRMFHEGGSLYSVIALGKYLEIEQTESECVFHCDESDYNNFWKSYFDLDGDYASYIGAIDVKDTYLSEAAAFGSGIRILRQDLWEMIVTFLISQQNNIARIHKCINNICERYGEKKESEQGKSFYTFPTPESLAGLEEDALMECNLGYRSKYVVRTAKSVVNKDTDLAAIQKLPYEEARAELLKLYGVGAKVADCICLFALHHLQAFPVDTHINQALSGHYQTGFPWERYDGYQGVLQQYIFFYELFGEKVRRQGDYE
ncbi:MAG: 8-oxoguanine DNA glycosylase [Clostridiales bacterium]|nr:8-oxoguanine DNA glycosylase [Clostridiales bacterium]